MLAKTFQDRETQTAYRYAVDCTATCTLIGTFLVKNLAQGSCEIGYSLGRKYWGAGYATELLAAMLEYLQAEGMLSIIATTKKENTASVRLLEKTGFVSIAEKATPAHLYFEYQGIPSLLSGSI